MSTSQEPSVVSAAPPIPQAIWTEHRNAQGRVYWYHQVEKRSVWEKPAELKTARERAIDSTPWKEYQSGERKYYVHSVTKESSWTVPKELRDLFESIPEEASPAPGTPNAAGNQSPAPASNLLTSAGDAPGRVLYTGPPPGFASTNGAASPMSGQTTVVQAPTGFAPPSSAPSAPRNHVQPSASGIGGEEAFLHLLKEKNINQNWTWEQTMREIITEPLYKSLATLAERKAAFAKYINNIKEQEQNTREERAKEVEPRIRQQMQPLIENGTIKPWLSYEGMLCRCGDDSAWKALESIGMNEVKELWGTLRREMRDQEASKVTELRHRNMDMLMSVLRTFEADVLTRWKDAKQTVLESSEWKSDAHLSTMDMSDMIAVFDEHMKTIEKEMAQELKEKAHKRKRQDRLMRDWFKEALQEGKREGWLHAKTNFADVYHRFKGNENFIRMLAQPGSTPLDLFFDVVDDLEKDLKRAMQTVDGLLGKMDSFGVEESTTWSEFQAALEKGMVDGEVDLKLSEVERKMVFEELQRINKEEKRRSERKLRHLSEDLRYALKKVAHHQPELFEKDEDLGKAWPDVVIQLQGLRLPEWKAFDEVSLPIDKERIEEARQGAWERFVKRQREKLEERRSMQTDEHSPPRKRRGEDGGEDESRRRSSRRASKLGEEESVRTSTRSSARRERRAGEMDETKEKDRKERRRSAAVEDFEAVKRQKLDDTNAAVEANEDGDSEKEEGEV